MDAKNKILFINQKRHINFADYLTKFNITEDTPQMWLDLQKQLIEAKWLQEHPDTWYKDAMQESESFINKQSNDKSNEDPSQTHHIDVNKPKPIKNIPLSRIGQYWKP